MNDSQGDDLFSSDKGILETVGLEFPRKALVEPGVSLGVGWFYGVGKNIQEVGRCNSPPCLRNRFFPKLVHPVLGVLGFPDVVAVDLYGFDTRYVWILESRIYQQGGT